MRALLLPAIFCLVLMGCATSSRTTSGDPVFVEVAEGPERSRLEQDWVHDKTWRYTWYYPDTEMLKTAYRIMERRGFPSSQISEVLYYRLEDDRHVLAFETEESDRGAQYHAFGYDRRGRIALIWIQFQPDSQTTIVEKLEVPK